MRATFTPVRWYATFTRVARLKNNPTTWDEMTDSWDAYSNVTWDELTA